MIERGQLDDVAELVDADRAGLGDAAEVVALEVDDHQVLGGVLVGGGELLGATGRARARALDRPGLDAIADRREEPLGRARDHGDAVGFDQRAVRRGRDLGERAVQRERIAGRVMRAT